MSLKLKELVIALTSVLLVVVLGTVIFAERKHASGVREPVVKADSAGCVKCHGSQSKDGPGLDPSLVAHWEHSAHALNGVGCADCHGVPAPGTIADDKNPRFVVKTTWDKETGLKSVDLVKDAQGRPTERPDLWKHEGAEIVTAVSPRTCAQCHEREAEEFARSRHQTASQFIGSIDNFLGRFAEGPAAAINGCQQCHGSVLRVAEPATANEPAELAADTWPNTGMGRVNLDGSWGSCSACHSRHEFSSAVARRPENCGKCHMGPDHPQIEIYTESKHGIAFAKNQDDLNLDNPGGEWVLGEDYTEAPTCATCHMGAVAPHGNYKGLEVTHDAGARIAWTLRPEISFQPKGIQDATGEVWLKEPMDRRDEMKEVCLSCHGPAWVDNFYVQFDQAVDLYNDKFGLPSKAIYNHLKDVGILDKVPMNEKLDYTYFELWHHEGRRARHGASMMGPDYVQWHGFYELSRNFYTDFLPEVAEAAEKAGKGEEVAKFVSDTLHGADGQDWERYHRWTEGLSPEQKAAMLSWEQENYGTRK